MEASALDFVVVPVYQGEKTITALEDIGRDTPFSGTYVPLDRYNIDRRVYSVMIELRRDQYLTDKGELVDIAAENLGAMLGRLVAAAGRGSR